MTSEDTRERITDMTRSLTPAEMRAIERHQRLLSQETQRDVPYEEAYDDWMANRAVAWREAHQARLLARQREEMLRHKWIESEKVHRDLGRDALLDWIARYAAPWREAFEREGADDENAFPPAARYSS
ncbi:MAG TPA: hypothetical protein PLO62_06930 [Candidatus Hydrogenedentes bacterium]|mgnify:CR=1 FL=1|nr:hypothetical protein [Candidatus Hydrogenedentota bacterium]HOS01847.1 hypothetical protein [Candidatus Hydrogenedentota bacterium]